MFKLYSSIGFNSLPSKTERCRPGTVPPATPLLPSTSTLIRILFVVPCGAPRWPRNFSSLPCPWPLFLPIALPNIPGSILANPK